MYSPKSKPQPFLSFDIDLTNPKSYDKSDKNQNKDITINKD